MDHSLRATKINNRVALTGSVNVPANADVQVDFGSIKNGIAEVHLTASRYGKTRPPGTSTIEVNATIETPQTVNQLRIIVNRCELSFLLDVTDVSKAINPSQLHESA